MTTIDLNCDLGEGGPNDAALMEIVSSANIACGIHAGDRSLMEQTVRLAAEKGVAIGAHPALPDREGFGRGTIVLEYNSELADLLFFQIASLKRFAEKCGRNLDHVKAHGTLYNLSVCDARIARFFAKVVCGVAPQAIVFALAGSEMAKAARALELRVAEEAFIDRGYVHDGTLIPRGIAGALIEDPGVAVERALKVVQTGKLTAIDGTELSVNAQTLCLHGDHPHALDLARALQRAFEKNGIRIRKVQV